jgi:hypothetical protein
VLSDLAKIAKIGLGHPLRTGLSEQIEQVLAGHGRGW